MSKPLYSSASALETADPKADGCYRKWWFSKVAKLPEERKTATTLGDVLHAVCERYEKADENGCDPEGRAVDLYPKGWENPVNKWTGKAEPEGISVSEQSLVKDLIAMAIKEGVLSRAPGREVEKKIGPWKVMDGVLVNGFIDLLEPGAVRDHKTTKAMKWAKSVKRKPDGTWPKNALALNIQMNLYAYWYFTEGGYPKDELLTLSHQYFVKDPQKPHVEKREVEVTWAEVEYFFRERIAPVLEMMICYREAKQYTDIPLPDNPASTCSKYGGCPFVGICTDQETVPMYTKRVNKSLSGVNNTNYKQVADGLKGEDRMESAVQKKIREARERKEALQAGAAVPDAVEKKTEPVVEKPEAVQEPGKKAPATEAAPWYVEGCKACSDNPVPGMKSNLEGPCKICDVMAKRNGGVTSDGFTIIPGEGVLEILDNETGESVLSFSSNETVTAKEQVADPAPAVEEPVVEEPVVEEPAADKPSFKEPVVEEPKSAPEPCGEDVFTPPGDFRVRGKFRLLLGAAIVESRVKGGGKFGTPSCNISAEELQMVVETEMTKIVGLKKWSEMNIFNRRDAVALYGPQIAEMVGSSTVIAARVPRGSFMEAIVSTIRPYAGEVIQALLD